MIRDEFPFYSVCSKHSIHLIYTAYPYGRRVAIIKVILKISGPSLILFQLHLIPINQVVYHYNRLQPTEWVFLSCSGCQFSFNPFHLAIWLCSMPTVPLWHGFQCLCSACGILHPSLMWDSRELVHLPWLPSANRLEPVTY